MFRAQLKNLRIFYCPPIETGFDVAKRNPTSRTDFTMATHATASYAGSAATNAQMPTTACITASQNVLLAKIVFIVKS